MACRRRSRRHESAQYQGSVIDQEDARSHGHCPKHAYAFGESMPPSRCQACWNWLRFSPSIYSGVWPHTLGGGAPSGLEVIVDCDATQENVRAVETVDTHLRATLNTSTGRAQSVEFGRE